LPAPFPRAGFICWRSITGRNPRFWSSGLRRRRSKGRGKPSSQESPREVTMLKHCWRRPSSRQLQRLQTTASAQTSTSPTVRFLVAVLHHRARERSPRERAMQMQAASSDHAPAMHFIPQVTNGRWWSRARSPSQSRGQEPKVAEGRRVRL